MLATNHVYDKSGEGLKSTLDTYIADEINFTGIRQSKDDKTYKVMTSGNIKVGFAEPRSDGDSNAKIANIIEYGKHNQPARPFLKPTKTSSRKPCKEAMIRTFEEEIKKL